MSVVGEALRETGSSLGMVFRNPALRKLNLAFAGSAIGDWAYATAMAVWVYSVGGVTAVGVWQLWTVTSSTSQPESLTELSEPRRIRNCTVCPA